MASMLQVVSPFDRTPIAEVPFQTENDVEQSLAEAATLHRKRQRLPKADRIQILDTAAGLLTERRREFAERIAREGGKPLTDALVEADRAAAGLKGAADALAHETGVTVPMDLGPSSANRTAVIHHEPVGPVVAVSAFNHPLNLIVHQVAPGVAAGCPVVVKPAPATPLSCIALVDLLREAGLPDAWCRPMIVDNELGEKLVTDPRVAFFTFIGSARVGWMLRSKLAPGTRCALEHGGAAPVLLEPDADLQKAIPRLVKGGYYHAGQVCVSVQRIFVHEDLMDAFLAAYIPAVEKLKTGDPLLEDTDAGPLIRPAEVDRIEAWVNESGGDVLKGGERLSETTYAPTVIMNPPAEANVSALEIFGPVTCIYQYRDFQEAVERANGVDWSFQAAVFTENLERAHAIAEGLHGSAIMVNDHTAFRVDWMPFAGRGQSGLGTGGIPYTFEDMRAAKLIVTRYD